MTKDRITQMKHEILLGTALSGDDFLAVCGLLNVLPNPLLSDLLGTRRTAHRWQYDGSNGTFTRLAQLLLALNLTWDDAMYLIDRGVDLSGKRLPLPVIDLRDTVRTLRRADAWSPDDIQQTDGEPDGTPHRPEDGTPKKGRLAHQPG